MSLKPKHFALTATAATLLALGGGIAAISLYAGADQPPAAAQAPAIPVEVAPVASREIVDWQHYSGRLEAVERVEIRPQVAGPLIAVHFKDGALVRQGELLFTIDPRPYAAELARADAQQAAADARLSFTAAHLKRAERLLADHAISRSDFEQAENAAREAAANRLAAQAAVSAARLNLGYTRITAPVAGRMSRAELTVGNVVAAGGTAPVLSTLVSVAKLYAAFDVDEQAFLKYIRPAQNQGQAASVFLGLANEVDFPRAGRVSSVDNRLDASAGTIRVRAEFNNPDGVLLPGLYARIRLGGGAAREAVLIDEKAIGTDQDKRFVLVVGEGNRTAYREVRLGAVQDGLRVVEAGLSNGERIVVNGLQRLRPGDVVQPQPVPVNKTQQTAALATPADEA